MKDISEYNFKESNSDLGFFPQEITFEMNKNIFINENNLQNININHLFLSPSNIDINGISGKRISPEWFNFYEVYVDSELIFQGDRVVNSSNNILSFGESAGGEIYAKYRHTVEYGTPENAGAMFAPKNTKWNLIIDPDPGSPQFISGARYIYWDTNEIVGDKGIDSLFNYTISHTVDNDDPPTFQWYSIVGFDIESITFKRNSSNMTYYEKQIDNPLTNQNRVLNGNSFRLFFEIIPDKQYKILEKKSVFANVPAVGKKIDYNRRVEVWTFDGDEKTSVIGTNSVTYITKIKWKREILTDETISKIYPEKDKANIEVVSYLGYFNQQTFKEDYNAI